MKLIFLDFDGVLHPNFCQEEHYFSRTGCRSRICSTACRLMAGQGKEPPAMEIDSLREHALFASSSATA